MKISKAYPHGPGRWRCKVKTPSGWKWFGSADSPEGATAIAQNIAVTVDTPPVTEDPADLGNPIPQDTPRLEPIRIEAPTRHRSGWRCRVISSAGRQWAPTAKTEARALRVAKDYAEGVAKKGDLTVSDCLAAYLTHQRDQGARPVSVRTQKIVISRLFATSMDTPLGRLSASRCQQIYDNLRVATSAKTHRPLAANTQRHSLAVGKTFMRWCIEKGWIRDSPLQRVKAVGKQRWGKAQPNLDSCRALWDLGIRLGAEGDDGAVAVLLALGLAMRAGEIVSRTCASIDGEGTLLRITDNPTIDFKAKTSASRRPLEIPVDLQPLIAARTKDKLPTALLFQGRDGGPRPYAWVSKETHRLCKLAGIPTVCAHSLRGAAATSATAGGALPHLVAQFLGHTSQNMTRQSYIVPGTVEKAALDRGVRVLKGGR